MELSNIELRKLTVASDELLLVTIKSDAIDVDTVQALRKQFGDKMNEVMGEGASKRLILLAGGEDLKVDLATIKLAKLEENKNGN